MTSLCKDINRIHFILSFVMLLTALTTDAQLWSQSIRFRQENLCPTTSASPSNLLSGVRSQQSCSVECALRSDCAVYGFNSSMSECRMASTEELLTSWQTPTPSQAACISQLNSRHPGVLSFRSSLIAYLDFRIGEKNLVNSARFGVIGKSSNIRFDSGGAVFPPIIGGESNYIELNTTAVSGSEPLGDLLGRGRNFTVYARVIARTNKTQMFYLMTNCTSNTSFRSAFAYFPGRLVMGYSLMGLKELKFRALNLTKNDLPDQIAGVSAGAVFDGTKFASAYHNGSLLDVEDFPVNDPTFSGRPECLKLGFNREARDSFVGHYVCFALARKKLCAQEFAELDQLCA